MAIIHPDHDEYSGERDALTGLYNRAYFDLSIKQEFDCADTNGSPLAIVFVDLDHFKAINDAHGHQSGDKVLAGTGHILSNSIWSDDIAARYGGEEFVLILPGVGAAGAPDRDGPSAAPVSELRSGYYRIGIDYGHCVNWCCNS